MPTSSSCPPLSVLTIPIPCGGDLVEALATPSPLAWVRRGEGIVGWGEAARLTVRGSDRFTKAATWWRQLVKAADVEFQDGAGGLSSSEIAGQPGTGLVAFGTFAFADTSPTVSVLTVPRVVVGRRGDRAWVTRITPLDQPAASDWTGLDGGLGVDDGSPTARPGTDPTPEPSDIELVAVPTSRQDTTPTTHPTPKPSDIELVEMPTRRAASGWGWERRVVEDHGLVRVEAGAHTRAAWPGVVGAALAAIGRGEVDKVVLARDIVATAARPIDPRLLLARLTQEYPSCWTFAVDGMIGATPELLLRSAHGLVTSRVLAGTIRRTGDDAANLARAAALARSSKDLDEHEYAVASVARALAPYCAELNVPETPYVLHLPNVMHLASDIAGVLSPTEEAPIRPPARPSAGESVPVRPDQPPAGDSDISSRAAGGPISLELAGALHPTAAVCGTPTEAARTLLAALEGADRGRYAAPVGWMGADGDGEWGIALRSAQLSPDRRQARLFAGGGIVAASNPADETAETDAKLAPMLTALGAN